MKLSMMWNQVTGSGYVWSAYIKGSSMVVAPLINYEEEAAPIPFTATDYGTSFTLMLFPLTACYEFIFLKH